MTEPVRNEDASPEQRARFMADARSKYPNLTVEDVEGVWRCVVDGTEFPFGDVIIVENGEPKCPHEGCVGAGWKPIMPLAGIRPTS